MSNEVRPIDHSSGSAFATTAGGTLWGGAKWGIGATLLWIGAATLLGAWLLPALMTGAITLALPSAATGWAILGGLLGLGAGIGTSIIPAVGGTVAGGISGGAKASQQVEQERAAARQLQMDVALVQAGDRGMAVDPRYNQAGSRVQADSVDNQGRVNGLALQRA